MTFEMKVRKFMGSKKYDRLAPSEKKTIRKLSCFQSKTKSIYKNGVAKFYEELGIL